MKDEEREKVEQEVKEWMQKNEVKKCPTVWTWGYHPYASMQTLDHILRPDGSSQKRRSLG